MNSIQGPAIFLAQFVGHEAPFDSLDGIARWAASHGYVGVQIPTTAPQLFDLDADISESKDLAAARPGVSLRSRAARVLAQPQAAKPGITLKVCAAEGLQTRFAAKRDKAAHAVARRLGWGDAVE